MELSLTFPTTELQGAFPANAETLFKFLVVNSKFADWIKNRITQYGFIENQDYIVKTTHTGRRPRKEYFVTLDMAKELCMVENNDKGKEARQYFIKCEKELQAIKFETYIGKIADLEASQILQNKRQTDQINGYKSQISQHNAVIVDLRNQLKAYEFKAEPITKIERLEADVKYYKALAHNHKMDKEFYQRKTAQAEAELDKMERVGMKGLELVLKQVDDVYTAIGAIRAFINDGDEFFMKQNKILERIDQ